MVSPASTWANKPPQGRFPTQPTIAPRHPYSTAFRRARINKEGVNNEALPAISRALTTPWWRLRETPRARGAARNPNRPINGARAFETAVPRARPTQTKVDQETCVTRAAASGLRPGKIPKPAETSRTASHATRKSVALRPAVAGELEEVLWVVCWASFISDPRVFLGNSLLRRAPKRLACLIYTNPPAFYQTVSESSFPETRPTYLCSVLHRHSARATNGSNSK